MASIVVTPFFVTGNAVFEMKERISKYCQFLVSILTLQCHCQRFFLTIIKKETALKQYNYHSMINFNINHFNSECVVNKLISYYARYKISNCYTLFVNSLKIPPKQVLKSLKFKPIYGDQVNCLYEHFSSMISISNFFLYLFEILSIR